MTDSTVTQRNSAEALELTSQQARFVAELVRDPRRNAAAAARRAGYSLRRAKVTASELLANPVIARVVGEIEAELRARAKLDRETLADSLFDAFAEARIEGDHTATVSIATLVAKLHGWIKDKHELSGPDGEPIPHSIVVRFVGARERLAEKVARLDATRQIPAGAPAVTDPASETKP
jgi:phage terminase small subunit